jgi:hypothetical protein
MSGHAGVAFMAVRGVERQHPAPRHAVLPGRVDEERAARFGMTAKAFCCAVDADTFNVFKLRFQSSLSRWIRNHLRWKSGVTSAASQQSSGVRGPELALSHSVAC